MLKGQNAFSFWMGIAPWKKTFFALAAGIIAGLLLGKKAGYLDPLGILFINALQMITIPVVFLALISAVISQDSLKKMGRISLKALLIYAISMIAASLIGLCVASFFASGAKLAIPLNPNATFMGRNFTFVEALTHFIPGNLVEVFTTVNILQMLVVSIFFGVAINMAGERTLPVKNFIQSLYSAAIKLTAILMSLAPFGVFAIIATFVGSYGLVGVQPLLKIVLAIYVSCFLLALLFYAPILSVFARLSPLRFFRGASTATIVAFSDANGVATLPVSLRCAEENLGVSRDIAGFVLPLGSIFNLNGFAIYLSILAVFSANMYDIHLGLIQYLMLVASIGVTSMTISLYPGPPRMLAANAVMTMLGLPLDIFQAMMGIDRIINMAITATNTLGDLFATVIVAKSENKLDLEAHNEGI